MTHTKLLITGGCGFIGSNLVRKVLRERPDCSVINLDALTYAGSLEHLEGMDRDPRHRFVQGDVRDRPLVRELAAQADAVLHLAAESHVDRSIAEAMPFVETNVLGTQSVIDAVRTVSQDRGEPLPLVHVSTDEVYGDLPLDQPDQKFDESSPIAPRSPYAASKAAADLLVRAAHETFGLDARIVRSSNNLGPWQQPEKLIPRMVTRLLGGQTAPLYGDGQHVRDWIDVQDHATAILAALDRGGPGGVYNVGAENPRSNLDIAHAVLDELGLPEGRIEFVADRPGHDRRYAVDASRAQRELGWRPTQSDWPECLIRTVRWCAAHQPWCQAKLAGLAGR